MSVAFIEADDISIVLSAAIASGRIKQEDATKVGRAIVAANKRAFVDRYSNRYPFEGPRGYKFVPMEGDVQDSLGHIFYNTDIGRETTLGRKLK